MSWKLGMLDICSIIVLLVILLMPPQSLHAIGAFEHRSKGDKARDVKVELTTASLLQAKLVMDPSNGDLVEEYADLMSDLSRHDMSLRIAGAASTLPSPSQWKSLGAVSAAFADSIDIESSLLWAEKSMVACKKAGSIHCPPHEEIRLQLFIDELKLGVKVLATGADPKFDPDNFRRELSKAHLTTRSGTKKE